MATIHMAMLTGGLNFQHGVSYYFSTLTIALKHTVFELGTWDKRTDGQQLCLMLPHLGGGDIKILVVVKTVP